MRRYLPDIFGELIFGSAPGPEGEEAGEGSPPVDSAFGPVEHDLVTPDTPSEPLDDKRLHAEIVKESKLDKDEEKSELYPPGLKLGGGAWVPSTYWGADYRRRLRSDDKEPRSDLNLRDRHDTEAATRSGLMLDTVFLALEDPTERH